MRLSVTEPIRMTSMLPKGSVARTATAIAIVVAAAVGALELEACSSLDSLATPGDDASGGGVESGTDAALPPGHIPCPSTKVSCDKSVAACCVTASGHRDPAPRSFESSSARCVALDASECGSYAGVGDGFTVEFEARCQNAASCTGGQVCCVAIDKIDLYVESITCKAPADCDDGGRTLCDSPDICGPLRQCVAETDPAFSHIYAKYCY